jgi:hypothetical protein
MSLLYAERHNCPSTQQSAFSIQPKQLATSNWQLATGNWQLAHKYHPRIATKNANQNLVLDSRFFALIRG